MDNLKFNLEVWQQLVQYPKLGEILVQQKKITIAQLTVALDKQKTENLPIGEILIGMGVITKNELVEVLELQTRIVSILDDSFSNLKSINNEKIDFI